MVAGEWEMTKELETAIQREVMHQSWTAEWAWRHLTPSLEPPPVIREAAKHPERFSGRVELASPVGQSLLNYQVIPWALTRVMLSASSVVSRILWPLTEKEPESHREKHAAARAEELRRRWNLPSDSYLSDRGVRNVFEHVEEKLETWIEEHPDRPAIGLMVGAISDDPELRRTCFRLLDPLTKIVYAGDEECDLARVFEALKLVSNRLPPIGFPVEIGIPKSWQTEPQG